MQKSTMYTYIIGLSAISLSLSGMEQPKAFAKQSDIAKYIEELSIQHTQDIPALRKAHKQESKIIDFAQELSLQHEADFCNILEAKKQEKMIKAEINKMAQEQQKKSQSLFKKLPQHPRFG